MLGFALSFPPCQPRPILLINRCNAQLGRSGPGAVRHKPLSVEQRAVRLLITFARPLLDCMRRKIAAAKALDLLRARNRNDLRHAHIVAFGNSLIGRVVFERIALGKFFKRLHQRRDFVDPDEHFQILQCLVGKLQILGARRYFLHVAWNRPLIRKQIDDINRPFRVL
jgi:hypothetical protein